MDAPQITQTIVREFLKHCGPSTYKPLGFLTCDEFVRECPPHPQAALTSLTRQFSADALIASGFACQNAEGQLALRDSFLPGQQVIVLTENATQQPRNLLTCEGCLGQGAIPVLEVLDDDFTTTCLETDGQGLAVAFDLQDVLLLRACGIAATLGTGLIDMSLEELEQFSSAFGWGFALQELDDFFPEFPNEPPHATPELPVASPFGRATPTPGATATADFGPGVSLGPPPSCFSAAPSPKQDLVFVAWTPHSLSAAVPPCFLAAVEELRRLDELLELSVNFSTCWTQSEDSLKLLTFFAEKRSAKHFRAALQEDFEGVNQSVLKFGEPEPRRLTLGPPADYATALKRLNEIGPAEQAARGLSQGDPKQQAWRDVLSLLEQDVVAPLRAQALGTSDPHARSLILGLAELSSLANLALVKSADALRHRLSGPPATEAVLAPEFFQPVLALTDRLIQMSKAIQQCQHPPHSLPNRIIDIKPTPRLPHSD